MNYGLWSLMISGSLYIHDLIPTLIEDIYDF